MTQDQYKVQTAHPTEFRAWAIKSSSMLQLKPATIARKIGASVNSVGAFLKVEGRNISMSRAHEIEAHIRAVAQEQGAELPPLRAGGE